MLATVHRATAWADDRAALRAACASGVGLCTIIGIEGSFSRRRYAPRAERRGGAITGSLADGCLSRQLGSEIAAATAPVVKRFGAGSELIDFRLPSMPTIVHSPTPDAQAARKAARSSAQAVTWCTVASIAA